MSIYDINQQELDQALEVYEAMGDERDKWRIRDEDGANKYMRIVRSLEGQVAEVDKMRKAGLKGYKLDYRHWVYFAEDVEDFVRSRDQW